MRPVTVVTQRKSINHSTGRKCFPTTCSNEKGRKMQQRSVSQSKYYNKICCKLLLQNGIVEV